MHDKQMAAPDSTAVRVALWRAMHVQVDPPPHVLEDEIGLRLAAPDEGWRRRPDMDPHATSHFRASIVARARFIEDLVVEQASDGVGQYVILGAGLDTFAQRRPEIASRLFVFEVEQPGPQAWKRQRLIVADHLGRQSVCHDGRPQPLTRPLSLLGRTGQPSSGSLRCLPWQWGRGVIARANLADLYAQGSWAEGSSAFASPFLLGDELKQGLVSSSRRTMTSG